MTDRTADPPALSGPSAAIAAELARRRMSWAEARARMPQDVRIGRTAWEDRMRTPGMWRLRELEAIAAVLGVPVVTLVGGEG